MKNLTHIVCVDDEPDILELITLTLTTVGNYKVTAYPTAKIAVDLLQDIRPDLLILDTMMPCMSGMDMIKHLKKNQALAYLPYIFMTARIQPKEQQEYINLGAIGVIPKPFDPMTLPKQIQEIWDQHQSTL